MLLFFFFLSQTTGARWLPEALIKVRGCVQICDKTGWLELNCSVWTSATPLMWCGWVIKVCAVGATCWHLEEEIWNEFGWNEWHRSCVWLSNANLLVAADVCRSSSPHSGGVPEAVHSDWEKPGKLNREFAWLSYEIRLHHHAFIWTGTTFYLATVLIRVFHCFLYHYYWTDKVVYSQLKKTPLFYSNS